MEPLLLCQHCGHKTSHTIIAHEMETEKAEIEENYFVDLDYGIWFTKCNNCEHLSLFSCLYDDPENAFSLFPAEKIVSDKIPKNIAMAYREALKVKKISKYAFIILIRRALELTCKVEKAKGKNLSQQVKDLGGKGILPIKLTDMAEMIRLIGNMGAHSDVSINDHEMNLFEDFFLAIIDYLYLTHVKIEQLRKKIILTPANKPAVRKPGRLIKKVD